MENEAPPESTIPVVSSPNSTEKKGITRREFIWRGAAAFAAVATGSLSAKEGRARKESAEVITPTDTTVFVDMVSGYDSQQLVAKMTEGISVGNTQDSEDLTSLANSMADFYTGHGEFVAGKFNETLGEIGYPTETPTMLPLQEALSVVSFDRDELGNPSVIFKTDEQKIGDLLEAQFNADPKIKTVNLSLQIGEARMRRVYREVKPVVTTNQFEIFDESTGTKYVTVATDIDSWAMFNGRVLPHRRVNGELQPLSEEEILNPEQYNQLNERHRQEVVADYQAGRPTDQIELVSRRELTEMYSPEFARENLAKLATLCRRFPDKSFNVAGGNENSYFYNIRREMEAANQWPANLTIFAGNERKSDGADIYVKAEAYGQMREITSSEATARGTALDAILASQGHDMSVRRSRIESFCSPTLLTFATQGGSGETRGARLLSPNLYRAELAIN